MAEVASKIVGNRLGKLNLVFESSNVKVNLNMGNNEGDSVLHCVVKGNHATLVEYLITLEEEVIDRSHLMDVQTYGTNTHHLRGLAQHVEIEHDEN
eukprot:CAMPEP_0198117032 /NCGR_PEP_ID=MMETSP1442-20131203/16134_1 /TAXON_ID= /ORGANISM="Craspedostauros australis, Strain CCMP3328" /LENGTH=95 /DNA_ID=CAMNT_0043774991 /DNA_START=1086 /DNA_END=1371 /DNA_ORIENTATION=+